MIIASVDLRPELLPVRHQGRRMSCLAFACSTAHEHRTAWPEHLSVEYLYYHSVAGSPGKDPNAGTTFAAAATALANEGQPVETAWPYSAIAISPWVPPTITVPLYKAGMQSGTLDFGEIVATLSQHRPVVLGLVITDAFYRPDSQGRIAFVTPDIERAGHAVLAVGHGANAAGNAALLIRNSWGDGWGLGGYGWLPRPYVDRQLRETAMLT